MRNQRPRVGINETWNQSDRSKTNIAGHYLQAGHDEDRESAERWRFENQRYLPMEHRFHAGRKCVAVPLFISSESIVRHC